MCAWSVFYERKILNVIDSVIEPRDRRHLDCSSYQPKTLRFFHSAIPVRQFLSGLSQSSTLRGVVVSSGFGDKCGEFV